MIPLEGPREEFYAAVADIGDVEQIIVPEGILHAEHPLLHIGGSAIAPDCWHAIANILLTAQCVTLRQKDAIRQRIAESIVWLETD